MDSKLIRTIAGEHDTLWESVKQEMLRYRSAYECNFWDQQNGSGASTANQIQIETSEGYGFIESYIGSLYAKHPAVVLKNGLRNKGNAAKSQAIANEFLEKSRKEIENASRMALIYTHAFVKLIPVETDDLLSKVLPVAIPPWEVIVDYDAPRWDKQKYVGHIYYMTVDEATDKFGALSWAPLSKINTQYFDNNEDDVPGLSSFQYIKVVEMYDLVNDVLYFWSPNVMTIDGHGGMLKSTSEEEVDVIPFRYWDGSAATPIIPFYFNSIPDVPLKGYSAMKRIYNQLFEMNIIRTFQANGVRKASRQWLVKKGSLDPEQMAQVTAGVDGLFLEIEEETLTGCIVPIPYASMPSEIEAYYRTVVNDKDKGSILAPFTRGEATRSTATEAAILASYSSSEIGRLARERDSVIEHMVKVYLSILGLYIVQGSKITLTINGRVEPVIAEDVLGDFGVYAADSSQTPMSEALNKSQFLNNVPLLREMGVPNEMLLDETVRILNLPESFGSVAVKEYLQKKAQEELARQPDQGSLPNVKVAEEVPSSVDLALNPSVKNVGKILQR